MSTFKGKVKYITIFLNEQVNLTMGRLDWVVSPHLLPKTDFCRSRSLASAVYFGVRSLSLPMKFGLAGLVSL